ncbi:hypothetical protein ACU635_50800 [[Actinomadura] parvosata]|uniref:hypothetical protein n=1 Tax=[Actinomadura] parvosata TaxID=1955412 RepID=UPI00406C5ACC
MRCSHAGAVPVESVVTGEVLAALCPDCDVQLPAEFLGCPHDDFIDTPSLSQPPGLGICNDCGASGWLKSAPRDPDAAIVAQLVAAGFDPASARQAVESKDPTLLTHTGFERPQVVVGLDAEVSAERLAEFEARFRAAQREPYRVMFLPKPTEMEVW